MAKGKNNGSSGELKQVFILLCLLGGLVSAAGILEKTEWGAPPDDADQRRAIAEASPMYQELYGGDDFETIVKNIFKGR